MSQELENNKKYAIRFGLGAIKAVGFNVMEKATKVREEQGNFIDIYDFAQKLEAKSINKKSIEALAKSGSFDSIHKNRRQISESFEILSAYSNKKEEESNSDQMSLFGGTKEADYKPPLKEISDWQKEERLQKEFEAFGFFLNEHPLDDKISLLKKRGVIFSTKIEKDELEDNDIVKIAGIIASSKHRSSARGRFAYLTISDPFGIFEAMIFDEELITKARDILNDGSQIILECLIKKDEGGIRILTKSVVQLEEFIKNTPQQNEDFEDIKKQKVRKYNPNWQGNKNEEISKPQTPLKKPLKEVNITISNRESVFSIKSIISHFVTINTDNFTKIYFVAGETKIALPQNYILDEKDVERIRKIDGVKVNIIY